MGQGRALGAGICPQDDPSAVCPRGWGFQGSWDVLLAPLETFWEQQHLPLLPSAFLKMGITRLRPWRCCYKKQSLCSNWSACSRLGRCCCFQPKYGCCERIPWLVWEHQDPHSRARPGFGSKFLVPAVPPWPRAVPKLWFCATSRLLQHSNHPQLGKIINRGWQS